MQGCVRWGQGQGVAPENTPPEEPADPVPVPTGRRMTGPVSGGSLARSAVPIRAEDPPDKE